MYSYEDEDNEPMNDQAYEYLRNKSKGGDQEWLEKERTRRESQVT